MVVSSVYASLSDPNRPRTLRNAAKRPILFERPEKRESVGDNKVLRVPMIETKRLTFGQISLALSALLFASSPSAADTIKVGGTGGALGTLKILADSFKKQHSEIEVTTLLGLSSGGA
jgi:hypothetical protein